MGRPIKVLYVHHIGASKGGSTNSLKYLIQSFPEGAVEALIVSPPGPAAEELKKSGAQWRPTPGVSLYCSVPGAPLAGTRLLDLGRVLWQTRYYSDIERAISEFQPDLVHFNEFGMLHAARRVKRKFGLPTVMHARGPIEFPVKVLHDIAASLSNRYIDCFLAIDGSTKHSLRWTKRCEIVYNPIPKALLDSSKSLTVKRRGTDTRVTFLSGLRPVKGVWDLAEAARILAKKGRKDILFLIGGGDSRPASFHKSLKGRLVTKLGFAREVEAPLKAFIQANRLESTVQLLGYVDDIKTLLLERTDILAFPSHLNGPARSVFEAGIFGIPSIVTMRDKKEDVVEDGVTGLICPERNPQALAEAIEKLADDPDWCRTMGETAKEKYRMQFAPERAASKTLEIYHDLLQGQLKKRTMPKATLRK
jgi:glycosyltransferase involved in cell wall biosynthesis